MTQRITTSFDLAALANTTTCGLDFARPPTCPQQTRDFRARQPTIARRAPIRQNNAHETAMQSLLGMMVDGSAQVFKIATCAAGIPSVFGITAARRTRDIRQSHTAPKIVKSRHARTESFLVGMPVCTIVQID